MSKLVERLVDSGRVPEPLLRAGIRAVCAQRLRQQRASVAEEQARHQRFVDELRASDIAIDTDAANAQHYEVPAEFFIKTLGPHLKYSSCYWPQGVDSLGGAEAAMLELYAERAELADGQNILDLGCGWGSFSLWAAARFPTASITGLSNSAVQRAHIERVAQQRGLRNLTIVTADIRHAQLPGNFDRVVSIEMFEHMRNYRALLRKVAGALKTDGKLFVHVFAHLRYAYPFTDQGRTDWMAREFFTGGLMPSVRLLAAFQDDVRLSKQWHLDGTHYQRTAQAWYQNLMAHRTELRDLFSQHYGPADARKRMERWRVFFLACVELFGYRRGSEWVVAHYLFDKR
jgi:cyclopropane-fatty-acyl-phospholipid synthase